MSSWSFCFADSHRSICSHVVQSISTLLSFHHIFLFKGVLDFALQTEPLEAAIEGKVPTWINGSFIRNGPGTFQGMKHLFDGYAMLAKFAFEDGKIKVSHR